MTHTQCAEEIIFVVLEGGHDVGKEEEHQAEGEADHELDRLAAVDQDDKAHLYVLQVCLS